jgi:hypothetical protein
VKPGLISATFWCYVDGTQSGISGIASGSVTIPTGIAYTGSYRAFLLENDSHTVISSELIIIDTVKARPAVWLWAKSYAPD